MNHPLFIFLHLPKTGGTTFNGHCMKYLELHREFIHFGPYGKTAEREAGLPPFHARDEPVRRHARVLAGHRTYYGIHELVPDSEPRYVLFARSPAARIISKYNGFMTRKKNVGKFRPFEEWYADEPKNEMTQRCNQFAGLRPGEPDLVAARELLDRLWFVGLTEVLDTSLAHLFAAIGIPTKFERMKVTGRKRDGDLDRMDREIPRLAALNDDLARQIEEDNPLDVALYRHAVQLYQAGPCGG